MYDHHKDGREIKRSSVYGCLNQSTQLATCRANTETVSSDIITDTLPVADSALPLFNNNLQDHLLLAE